MDKIIPKKLKQGDTIRIIAPSKSLSTNTEDEITKSKTTLESLGLKVEFSEHCREIDILESSSIESRIADLHSAFADSNVKGIICAKGGFNANDLLEFIDWELIKNNPKIFAGYSDITVLNAAIYAKTGMVNYSSPTFSSYKHEQLLEYSIDYMHKVFFEENSFELKPSELYSDWTNPDDAGNPKNLENTGYWVINEGKAEGTIIGENLCTLNLLQGTEYFPKLSNSILFIEDDYESKYGNFDRDLQSLMHIPSFKNVKGLVIGRFQSASEISQEILSYIIKSKPKLNHMPIMANLDFGHTNPRITLPVGGTAKIDTSNQKIEISQF
jgi:muramoyltetrapeptide carboxypeptidase